MNKEKVLITHLRRNDRMSLTEMSKKTAIPVSTLFDMLKRSRIIQKHTCIADFSQLGYSVKAIFLVQCSFKEKEDFRIFVGKQENLNFLLKVNNGFDFIFEVICKDVSELELFNENLDSRFEFKQKQVHYILDDIMRESFMCNSFDVKSHQIGTHAKTT